MRHIYLSFLRLNCMISVRWFNQCFNIICRLSVKMASYLLPILCLCLVGSEGYTKKQQSPPHCTQLTKDTDYVSKFKLDYPLAYIHPGQREAYQQMYCVGPPAVNKAVGIVCDWAAPPQVQFSLGDEYLHIVRQDPYNRFDGNAVITTYQLCGHNKIPSHLTENYNVSVTGLFDS